MLTITEQSGDVKLGARTNPEVRRVIMLGRAQAAARTDRPARTVGTGRLEHSRDPLADRYISVSRSRAVVADRLNADLGAGTERTTR